MNIAQFFVILALIVNIIGFVISMRDITPINILIFLSLIFSSVGVFFLAGV